MVGGSLRVLALVAAARVVRRHARELVGGGGAVEPRERADGEVLDDVVAAGAEARPQRLERRHLVREHVRRVVDDQVEHRRQRQRAQRGEIRRVDAEERVDARVAPRVGVVEAAVPPLLPRRPRELRRVAEALGVDVGDPQVRAREVLAPRVEAARRLVAHAELEHLQRVRAARPEHRVVRRAVVVLAQPVRALVRAPLVEERVERRAVVGRAAVRVAGRRRRTLREIILRPGRRQREGRQHRVGVRGRCAQLSRQIDPARRTTRCGRALAPCP